MDYKDAIIPADSKPYLEYAIVIPGNWLTKLLLRWLEFKVVWKEL